ncbi:MAG: hypothetical protein A2V66_16020 [Ignavibacteria bacterium RBG_13_36_8]|nr:MAG: hypothetical protein A2V66_16020 [Ignavibacteria bacterium RBG_13_36_8]
MKKARFIFYLLVFTTANLLSQQSDFPKLTGPYLGQTLPGVTPEIFAKDIISPICPIHGCPVFTPDGKEIYWAPMDGGNCEDKTDEILFMKLINNVWTEPEVVPFSSTFFDSDDPCISPDGKRIYFNTHRPSGLLSFDFAEKIMYVERVDDDWSSPQSVGSVVNSLFRHWQISVTKNYDLYFHAEKNVEKPGIYVSRYNVGEYQTPERLPAEINSGNPTMPYIAPDESYLIFVRTMKESGDDLFISYKDSNGKWTEAKTLGDKINSTYHDLCPNVTPDGKYIFFLSQRDGESYAYWVDAKIIEALRH